MKHLSGISARLAVVAVLAAGFACGEATTGPRLATIGSIRLSCDTLAFSAVTETRIVSATARDTRGLRRPDARVLFSVSDTAVAGVSAEGVVVARANGVAWLIGSASDVRDSARIVVAQVPAAVRFAADSLSFDALGDRSAHGAAAYDSAGMPIPEYPLAIWSADSTVAAAENGQIVSRGNGRTRVIAAALGRVADTLTVRVEQRVTAIAGAPDAVTFTAVGAERDLEPLAVDHLGTRVAGVTVALTASDSTVATLSAAGTLRAVGNGSAAVTARVGDMERVIAVRVAQLPVAVRLARDTVRLDALGATAKVEATAVDSLGHAVAGAPQAIETYAPGVVAVVGDSTRAVANGIGAVGFRVAGLLAVQPVLVAQRAVQLTVAESLFTRPLARPAGAVIDLGARGVDRLGGAITSPVLAVAADTSGVTDVLPDGRLVVAGSGWVDLSIASGDVALSRRLRVFVPPELVERPASHVSIVGLPDTVNPWAPTLVRAPDGKERLYIAAYKPQPNQSRYQADLDYFESSDGETFVYRGTSLAHQPNLTDPYGWGIENIGIAPRSDGAGYRLFFSAGSTTLGWQVFSAVGDGLGPWQAEPGVRVSNEGGQAPQGEGMVLFPRAGGGWRMIEGSMVSSGVSSGSWQIVEYESDDQLTWRFKRDVLRENTPLPGDERAVYSPSITRFGRGGYRMFYTGDNLRTAGGTSQLWSAVSFDLETWTVEGVFVPWAGSNVFYASVLGDKLAYVTNTCGGCRGQLEIARIRQR